MTTTNMQGVTGHRRVKWRFKRFWPVSAIRNLRALWILDRRWYERMSPPEALRLEREKLLNDLENSAW